MYKKLLILAVLIVVIAAVAIALTGCGLTPGTLQNHSFETIGDDGVPVGWEWHQDGPVSLSTRTMQPGTGEYAAFREQLGTTAMRFNNTGAGYNFLTQPINLRRGQVYRISAWMWIDTTTAVGNAGRGAFIGFVEDTGIIDVRVTGSTQPTWQEVSMYVIAGTPRTLTLAVGLGNDETGANHGATTGNILIDNITITEVTAAQVPSGAAIRTVSYFGVYDFSEPGSAAFTWALALFSVALLLGAYLYIRNNVKQGISEAKMAQAMQGAAANTTTQGGEGFRDRLKSPLTVFVGILLFSFLIRLLFVLVIPAGWGAQLSRLTGLSQQLYSHGTWGVMQNHRPATEMPYGVLSVLFVIGHMANWFNVPFGSVGFHVMLRIPMIVMDIVGIYIIYVVASKYYGSKIGAVFAGLYGTLPFIFTASSIMALTVMMGMPFLMLAFVFALNKRFAYVAVFYSIALSVNYFFLFLAPVFIGYAIFNIWKEDTKARMQIIVSNVASLVGFMLFALAFTVNMPGNIFFLFTNMWRFFSAHTMLAENTFNIYAMFGLNTYAANEAMFILQFLFVIVLMSISVYVYLGSKNRLNMLLMSAWMFIILAVIGAQSTMTVMLIGVLLLFLYVVFSGERRMFTSFGLYAILLFINQSVFLGRQGYITNNPNARLLHFPQVYAFTIVFSVLTLLVTVYFTYVTVRITMFDDARDFQPLRKNWFVEQLESVRRKKNNTIAFFKRGKA